MLDIILSIVKEILEFVVKYPIAFPILVIVYWLFYPEKVELLSSQFYRLFTKFSEKARKRTVASNIQAHIKLGKKKKFFGTDMNRFLPENVKIKWIKFGDDEAILNDNEVLIRMSHKTPRKENFVRAVQAYVSEGFISDSRRYIDINVLEAADHNVISKIIRNGYGSAENLFEEKFSLKYHDNIAEIRSLINDINNIDRDGLFYPIVINEFYKIGKQYHPSTPDDALIQETREFLRFILNISTKDPGMDVPLSYNGEYFKVSVHLAIGKNELSEIDEELSYKTILKSIKNSTKKHIKDKVETIYILALGRKIDYAKDIAKQLIQEYPQLTLQDETRYKNIKRRFKKGICVEISVDHD